MKRLLLTLALTACSQSAQKTALPSAEATASASAPPATSGKGKPDEPQPSSPFVVVAEGTDEFFVHPLAAKTFVSAGSFLGSLESEGIVDQAELTKGLGLSGPMDYTHVALERIFGRWPSDAWIAFIGSTGRSGYSVLHKWSGSAWVSAKQTNVGSRTLLVYENESATFQIMSDSMGDFSEIGRLSGSGAGPKFSSYPAAEDDPTNHPYGGRRAKTIAVVATAGPGGALAAGMCAWHWAKAKKNAACFDQFVGKDATFGTIDDFLVQSVASNRQAYFLGGSGGIYRVEKGVATPLSLPRELAFVGPIAAAADKDDLWAVTDRFASKMPSELWRKDSEGWKKIALPNGLQPGRVWVLGSGDVLVTAEDSLKRHFLLSSRKMPLFSVKEEAFKQKVKNIDAAVAYTSSCQQPMVLLYEVQKKTPADFAFSDTAKALTSLKGMDAIPFLDFDQGGKRFFGAKLSAWQSIQYKDSMGTAPSDPQPLAKQIIAAISKAVAGSKPQLVCHAPTPTRELHLDPKKEAFIVTSSR